MTAFFQTVINWYMTNLNYGTIVLLMTIESSFIPFPSEVVIPPAAYKAANGELNLYLVMISGIIGSILGALFNYYIALSLGRKIIYSLANTRLAHLMMINAEGIEKSEKFFVKYGKSATFIGRLIPAIRQLISIPAGLAKMNLKDFLFYTILGSGIWNIILALLGYFMYAQKEKLELYYSELSWAMIIAGVLFVFYLIYKSFKKTKKIEVE
jgi:membrane protein DedA with SNARE-associated domain